MRAAMRFASRARAMMRNTERLLQTYCMVVLAVFALGFMLIELKGLLLPLCFALFISLLYAPIIDTMTCRSQPRCMSRNSRFRTTAKRKFSIIGDDGQMSNNCWNSFVSSTVDMIGIGKIPKPLAILFAICSAFAVLAGVGWIVYDAINELYDRKDEYEQRADEILDIGIEWAGAAGVNVTKSQIKSELEDLLVNSLAVGFAEGIASFIAQTVLMIVFLIFILFMRSSRPPATEIDLRTNPWAAVKFKAQQKVQRYILVKTFISMATGILVGFMLGLLGAPLPTVFGLLTFLLNFVPSIGSWIATFLPVPVILFDPNQTISTALLAILLPGAAQVIIGDFIEPHFLGRLCQVAPLVVLVSLMLFGYLWGIGGMVLALPITIVIKLVCKQIPHPIPRYIAGLIFGDLTKYKRQLDRHLMNFHMHRKQRRRGLASPGGFDNPYHTDDETDDAVPDPLQATDAQLSHIVLHDDDDDDDGPSDFGALDIKSEPPDQGSALRGSDHGTDYSDVESKRTPARMRSSAGYLSSTDNLARLDPNKFDPGSPNPGVAGASASSFRMDTPGGGGRDMLAVAASHHVTFSGSTPDMGGGTPSTHGGGLRSRGRRGPNSPGHGHMSSEGDYGAHVASAQISRRSVRSAGGSGRRVRSARPRVSARRTRPSRHRGNPLPRLNLPPSTHLVQAARQAGHPQLSPGFTPGVVDSGDGGGGGGGGGSGGPLDGVGSSASTLGGDNNSAQLPPVGSMGSMTSVASSVGPLEPPPSSGVSPQPSPGEPVAMLSQSMMPQQPDPTQQGGSTLAQGLVPHTPESGAASE